MGGGTVIRLTAIEQSILLWEQASALWNSHMDVSAPTLDPGRLREAFNAALAHHELASAHIDLAGSSPSWVLPVVPVDIGEIPVVDCGDDAAVARLRDAELDRPIPLDRPPLVRAVIARRPNDDLLITTMSHVMCDGIGTLRLMRSVGRAYRGVEDPPPAVQLGAARAVLVRPAPATLGDAARRWATSLDLMAKSARPRARVAAAAHAVGAGNGVVTRTALLDDIRPGRRRSGASFEEYALGALHVALGRWNDAHGSIGGRVGVAFGVNLRPPDWYDDVVANIAAFVSVTTEPEQRATIEAAVAAVRPQVAVDQRLERARLVVDAARASMLVPAGVREAALRSASPDLFDSFSLSNGGNGLEPACFADGYDQEVWVSQPAVPSVGLAMGVFGMRDRLWVTARFRRERFDDAGAAAVVEGFLDCLTSP